MKICQKCNQKNKDEAIYCANCGALIEEKVSQNTVKDSDETSNQVAIIIIISIFILAYIGANVKQSEYTKANTSEYIEANSTEANATVEANLTEVLAISDVNKSEYMEVNVTSTNVQNTLFSNDNIKIFLESQLQSGCFKSADDVAVFFSKSIYKYYESLNPTFEMILYENRKYCNRWDYANYQLNSFNILTQSNKNGIDYVNVVANISYKVLNSKKTINGTVDTFFALANENGQLKIISIYSKNNHKTTHTNSQVSHNGTLSDSNNYQPTQDEILQSAIDLIGSTYDEMVIDVNSKGKTIYCTQDKDLCKTEQEVIDFTVQSKR